MLQSLILELAVVFLAITFKKLNKDFTVYATDIVQETLEVASDNAHYHEVAVTF